MKRGFTFIGMIVCMCMASGCLYSIYTEPQTAMLSPKLSMPFDMSMSLGSIEVHFMQKSIKLTEREMAQVNHTFIDVVEDADIVSTVVSRGGKSDLVVDVINAPDIATGISRKKSLYRDIMTVSLLGFITPLPYPFYIEAEGHIRIKHTSGGTDYILKDYAVTFTQTIWSASIIGARYKRALIQDHMVRYLVPIMVDNMKKDEVFFRKCEEVFLSHDEERITEYCTANA